MLGNFNSVARMSRVACAVLLVLCATACAMVEPLPQAVQFTVVEPGIRKTLPLDAEFGTTGWYEQYDAETDGWYQVRRGPDGNWVRTYQGEQAYKERLETLRETSSSAPAVSPAAPESVTMATAAPAPEPLPVPIPTPAPEPMPAPAPPVPDKPIVQESLDRPASLAAAEGVRIIAHAGTWLTAAVDGGPRQDVFLEAGESLQLQFSRECLLTVGDAEAVSLTRNGEPYAAALSSGQEVRLLPN